VLTIVTAGMASQLVPVDISAMSWALILLAVSLVVLASGGYALLDGLMKLMMVLLAVCTLVALLAAVFHGPAARAPAFEAPEVWSVAGIAFLVALMGWMPTPVDASAWPSLWMQARARQTGHRPTLGEALVDFKIGYWGSLITALMFLSLGALVMFGTGDSIAGSAHEFAARFVGMYTNALGAWSRPIIVAMAFATMLSTLLTVLDAYPRVLTAGCRLAWPRAEAFGRAAHWVFMAAMMAGALMIFTFVTIIMRPLVDVTTTVAFLSAPLFAYLNFRVISTGAVPADAAPPAWLRVLSRAGLIFLTFFSILFLVVHFGFRS
jgi:Mn2+/Fe2+ NRAMP family transporter